MRVWGDKDEDVGFRIRGLGRYLTKRQWDVPW